MPVLFFFTLVPFHRPPLFFHPRFPFYYIIISFCVSVRRLIYYFFFCKTAFILCECAIRTECVCFGVLSITMCWLFTSHVSNPIFRFKTKQKKEKETKKKSIEFIINFFCGRRVCVFTRFRHV